MYRNTHTREKRRAIIYIKPEAALEKYPPTTTTTTTEEMWCRRRGCSCSGELCSYILCVLNRAIPSASSWYTGRRIYHEHGTVVVAITNQNIPFRTGYRTSKLYDIHMVYMIGKITWSSPTNSVSRNSNEWKWRFD